MNQLHALRKQVSKIDKRIVQLIFERFRITHRIMEHKMKENISAEDLDRETQQNQMLKLYAEKYNLDETMLIEIFDKIRTQVKQKTD